jgi:hypothetical protein
MRLFPNLLLADTSSTAPTGVRLLVSTSPVPPALPPAESKRRADGSFKRDRLNAAELVFELARRGRDVTSPTSNERLRQQLETASAAERRHRQPPSPQKGGAPAADECGESHDDGGEGTAAPAGTSPLAPRVRCARPDGTFCHAEDGSLRDFGSAVDARSFVELAKHLNAVAPGHPPPDDQALYDMGVHACPACHRFFSTVGKNPPWMLHWTSKGKGCAVHAAYEREEAHGWRSNFIRECHQRASPSSPAGYHNHAGLRPSRQEGGQRQAATRQQARHDNWAAFIARQTARQRQEEERAAFDARAGFEGQRLGGSVAEQWGQRDAANSPVSLAQDLQWLDLVTGRAEADAEATGADGDRYLRRQTAFLHELDTLVSRNVPRDLRAEYLQMLTIGLEYIAQHQGHRHELRGWAFIILAKACTTGRLRSDCPRSINEVRGRIRMVNQGLLRTLTVELFRDAEEAALQAARQRQARNEERVRTEAEAADAAHAAREREAAAAMTGEGEIPAADGERPQSSDAPLDLDRVLASALRLCAAGYLSKGYAQFTASPLAEVSNPKVRDELRDLHPQAEVHPPSAYPDKEGVDVHFTTWPAFCDVFSKPPQERGISLDALSYEELQQLYHHGPKKLLYRIVCGINAGRTHPDAAEVLGESILVGLEKPDKGTRPIGVGAAMRRLAGRCIYVDISDTVGRTLTRTAPTPEMLEAEGHPRNTPCNVPLQLGCGISGGAEILVAAARLGLELKGTWAILSDDKKNGFNSISRKAIYDGLYAYFPQLIPHFRQFYARAGRLFTIDRDEGRRQARDGDDADFFSMEGCVQGDPMGPLYWAVGYHQTLLRTQARHPNVFIWAYLDDTYYFQAPCDALAALRSGEELSPILCNVHSNLSKQEAYGGHEADLDEVPATIKGSPHAPPHTASGYPGGRLPVIKVLGTWLGDFYECSRRLVARVEKKLKPLEQVALLRDTRQVHVAMQVQMQVNRYCANTSLIYFLRTMGSDVTRCAAARHDALVEQAFHSIVAASGCSPAAAGQAIRQARLPVKMGGAGLTSMQAIAPAACVGSWQLVWRPLQTLCPGLFAGVDPARHHVPALRQLQRDHTDLMQRANRVRTVHDTWDAAYFDYDHAGNGHGRFHPSGLPPHSHLSPLSELGSASKHHQHAQRTWSRIIHHSEWVAVLRERQLRSARAGVHFLAVSAPGAGLFLNAVPKYAEFKVPTWALQIILARRFALPVQPSVAVAASSRHGFRFDELADVAQNDGVNGHGARHHDLLMAIYKGLRRAFGKSIQHEQEAEVWSSHRPDLVLEQLGLRAYDLKFLDPIGSNAAQAEVRGAYVAFGNTAERAEEIVNGRAERGVCGVDGTFNRRTGEGYVSPLAGDYDKARSHGVECAPLLVETLGGFGPQLLALIQEASKMRADKLTKGEYDEATWATRGFSVFVMQSISVALHVSAAEEIARACGGSVVGVDLRPRPLAGRA